MDETSLREQIRCIVRVINVTTTIYRFSILPITLTGYDAVGIHHFELISIFVLLLQKI